MLTPFEQHLSSTVRAEAQRRQRLLTTRELAEQLRMPERTARYWLARAADGGAVQQHGRRGWAPADGPALTAVQRATLDALVRLARSSPPRLVTGPEVAVALGVAPPTARKRLRTLQAAGLVTCPAGPGGGWMAATVEAWHPTERELVAALRDIRRRTGRPATTIAVGLHIGLQERMTRYWLTRAETRGLVWRPAGTRGGWEAKV